MILTADKIPQVAKIHQDLMPQSLYSRLGADFLEVMYRCLAEDPQARVWMDVDGDRVVATSCGTLDLHATHQRLRTQMPWTLKARALVRMLTHWTDLTGQIAGYRLERYCKRFGDPYPSLMTLAVVPGAPPATAYKLLQESHEFYQAAGCREYFFDTLVSNQRAQLLHKLLGFQERGRIAGMMVLSRKIDADTGSLEEFKKARDTLSA